MSQNRLLMKLRELTEIFKKKEPSRISMDIVHHNVNKFKNVIGVLSRFAPFSDDILEELVNCFIEYLCYLKQCHKRKNLISDSDARLLLIILDDIVKQLDDNSKRSFIAILIPKLLDITTISQFDKISMEIFQDCLEKYFKRKCDKSLFDISKPTFIKIFSYICSCGDYSYQRTLIKICFEIIAFKIVKQLLLDEVYKKFKQLRTAFENFWLNDELDTNLTILQNTLNNLFNSVISIKCESIFADGIVVNDFADGDLFADFNTKFMSISFHYEQGDNHSREKAKINNDDKCIMWDMITLNYDMVSTVIFSKWYSDIDKSNILGEKINITIDDSFKCLPSTSFFQPKETIVLAVFETKKLEESKQFFFNKIFQKKISKSSTQETYYYSCSSSTVSGLLSENNNENPDQSSSDESHVSSKLSSPKTSFKLFDDNDNDNDMSYNHIQIFNSSIEGSPKKRKGVTSKIISPKHPKRLEPRNKTVSRTETVVADINVTSSKPSFETVVADINVTSSKSNFINKSLFKENNLDGFEEMQSNNNTDENVIYVSDLKSTDLSFYNSSKNDISSEHCINDYTIGPNAFYGSMSTFNSTNVEVSVSSNNNEQIENDLIKIDESLELPQNSTDDDKVLPEEVTSQKTMSQTKNNYSEKFENFKTQENLQLSHQKTNMTINEFDVIENDVSYEEINKQANISDENLINVEKNNFEVKMEKTTLFPLKNKSKGDALLEKRQSQEIEIVATKNRMTEDLENSNEDFCKLEWKSSSNKINSEDDEIVDDSIESKKDDNKAKSEEVILETFHELFKDVMITTDNHSDDGNVVNNPDNNVIILNDDNRPCSPIISGNTSKFYNSMFNKEVVAASQSIRKRKLDEIHADIEMQMRNMERSDKKICNPDKKLLDSLKREQSITTQNNTKKVVVSETLKRNFKFILKELQNLDVVELNYDGKRNKYIGGVLSKDKNFSRKNQLKVIHDNLLIPKNYKKL